MLSRSQGLARCQLVLLALGFLSPFNAFPSDVVRLKNGDVISGRLVSYFNDICIFDTHYGATVRLPVRDVASLTTDEVYQVVFASGEKISGRLSHEQEKPVLKSATFGTVAIDISTVKSLTRSFAKEEGKYADDKKTIEVSIGEEDRKQPPLTFLTGSTVMLPPGKYEIDMGLAYKQSRDASSLPVVGYFQMSSYAARQTMFDTTIRGGLYKDVEGWLTIPFSYSYVEQVSSNAYVRSKDAWDIGDLSFGLQYLLRKEDAKAPAISTSIAVTAPTGKMQYYGAADEWKAPLNNGGGYWRVSPSLSFVRTTDPAIIFGGVNASYAFRRTIDGYDVKPGWGTGFYLGVGYALNENLSVGTRFAYSYLSRMEFNGERIYGSDKDPMDLSLSASYRFADKWVATPLVSYSLNNDAGVSSVSLRLKRQLD